MQKELLSIQWLSGERQILRGSQMDMKQVEGFHYYQDEKHATVLIVDYLRHYI